MVALAKVDPAGQGPSRENTAPDLTQEGGAPSALPFAPGEPTRDLRASVPSSTVTLGEPAGKFAIGTSPVSNGVSQAPVDSALAWGRDHRFGGTSGAPDGPGAAGAGAATEKKWTVDSTGKIIGGGDVRIEFPNTFTPPGPLRPQPAFFQNPTISTKLEVDPLREAAEKAAEAQLTPKEREQLKADRAKYEQEYSDWKARDDRYQKIINGPLMINADAFRPGPPPAGSPLMQRVEQNAKIEEGIARGRAEREVTARGAPLPAEELKKAIEDRTLALLKERQVQFEIKNGPLVTAHGQGTETAPTLAKYEDQSAGAAIEALKKLWALEPGAKKHVPLLGSQMNDLIRSAIDDLDNNAAGAEHRDLSRFVTEHWNELSESAKKVWGVYERYVKDAQSNGSTGISAAATERMLAEMGQVAGVPENSPGLVPGIAHRPPGMPVNDWGIYAPGDRQPDSPTNPQPGRTHRPPGMPINDWGIYARQGGQPFADTNVDPLSLTTPLGLAAPERRREPPKVVARGKVITLLGTTPEDE